MLFSQRGHPEGGSSSGESGDGESHPTKLSLSCLRDMLVVWAILEGSLGWRERFRVIEDMARWLRQGQPERRRGQGLDDTSTPGKVMGNSWRRGGKPGEHPGRERCKKGGREGAQS